MRELGKKAGVNPVTIGRLEKGRQHARLGTVNKLAQGLRNTAYRSVGKEVSR
jgi:DNA-binding XRE family transcriptional regulator